MTGIATSVDAARVELLLNELRLPGVKAIWPKLAAQSDKEGWPAARFLAALAEHEAADRTRRRIERHMVEARLPARSHPDCRAITELLPIFSRSAISRTERPSSWVRRRIVRISLTVVRLACFRLGIGPSQRCRERPNSQDGAAVNQPSNRRRKLSGI